MLKCQRIKDFGTQRTQIAQIKAKASVGVAEKTYILFFLTFCSSLQASAQLPDAWLTLW
jgi:hypothetical protein|tara:strand:+ start:294 stop:470 length:177 start_codon:yes stop_codon:yes gene_type:complete